MFQVLMKNALSRRLEGKEGSSTKNPGDRNTKGFCFCSSVLPLIRKVWTAICSETGKGPLKHDRLKVGPWFSKGFLRVLLVKDTCNDTTRTSPLMLSPVTLQPRPSSLFLLVRLVNLTSFPPLSSVLIALRLPPSILTLLRKPQSIHCGSIWISNCVCICTSSLRKCVEKTNEGITQHHPSINLNLHVFTQTRW